MKPSSMLFPLLLSVLLMPLLVLPRANDPVGTAPTTPDNGEYMLIDQWPHQYTAAPGEFSDPHGIAAASDGSVYIADFGNERIQKFTADGQFVTMWGIDGTRDGQFRRNYDVATAPDGSVYVTDTGNQRIQRFTANGQFLTKWNTTDAPASVSVGPDGSVYSYLYNETIQKFTADGHLLRGWEGAFDRIALAVGPDGTVYEAYEYPGKIRKYSSEGTLLGEWGEPGSGNGQLRSPTGIAVGPDNSVYVTDSGNSRIQRFTSNGEFLGKWGCHGSQNGQFSDPYGIAVGPQGSVYVVDRGNNRVQKFTPNGEFVAKWGNASAPEGFTFDQPRSVTLGQDGAIYVTNRDVGTSGLGDHSIYRLTSAGELVTRWGSRGAGNGQLQFPHGIAVGPGGDVYIADTYNHRVQQFGSSGEFLAQWGIYGTAPGQFRYPYGIATGQDGSVYVADTLNHRIQKFTANGQFLVAWGNKGDRDGQFYTPYGVAVGPEGTIYVADTGNSRIQKFTDGGEFLTKWSLAGTGTVTQPNLVAVEVGPDSAVYAVDLLAGVLKFTSDGEFISQWDATSQLATQGYVTDIAVDAQNLAYIPNPQNRNISVFVNDPPTSWHGQYYNNRWLVGEPVLIRDDPALDFVWGASSPGAGVNSDEFSARWVRTAFFASGSYRFAVTANDGIRLWVGDQLVVDRWQNPQNATYTAELTLPEGYQRLQVEYYEANGEAAIHLSWTDYPSTIYDAIQYASEDVKDRRVGDSRTPISESGLVAGARWIGGLSGDAATLASMPSWSHSCTGVMTGTYTTTWTITNPNGLGTIAEYRAANFDQKVLSQTTNSAVVQITSQAYLNTHAVFPVNVYALPSDIRPYLQPDSKSQSDDPLIQAQALALVRDLRTQAQAVDAIVTWVRANVRWGSFAAQGMDAISVFRTRWGVCEGFSNLTVALLRAAGIPSRYRSACAIAGNYAVGREGGSHAAIETYYPDAGWVPSEPQAQSNFINTSVIFNMFAGCGSSGTVIASSDPPLNFWGFDLAIYCLASPHPNDWGAGILSASVAEWDRLPLRVEPPQIQILLSPGNTGLSRIIEVDSNDACDPTAWTVVSNVPWMTAFPIQGIFKTKVTLTVNPTLIASGWNFGTVTVASDSGATRVVPVSVLYSENITHSYLPVITARGSSQETRR